MIRTRGLQSERARKGGGMLSDADARHLAAIGDDCATVLGPGIELLGVDREDHAGSVRLVARYRRCDRAWESAVTGETIVAAHAMLRARLLFDRIRLGFTTLVEPH